MELRTSSFPAPGGDTTEALVDANNEDATAVAADGSAAVLVDGAGLPWELRTGCGHPVSWYAQTLADAMLARLLARTGDPRTALAEAIADVRDAHGPGCRPDEGSPSSTLAAWRVTTAPDGAVVEYVVLADSSLFVRHVDGRIEEIVDEAVDLMTGPARATVAAELIAAGADPAAARVEAFRQTTERLRNVDGGFWCCHVDPAAAAHALTGRVPLADVDALVLASDGATRLVHPYGELSPGDFVAWCLGGSHEELAARLRVAEAANAEAAGRIAVKVHDDATIVAGRCGAVGAEPRAAHPGVPGVETLADAPGYRIRRARAADVPAIVGLLAADQLGATRDGPADDPAYAAAFARIDADPGELLVVVVDAADAVVGTFQLSLLPGLARRGTLRCQIEAVRIAAATRGSGVGAAALRWAIEWARAQGCSLLQLTTDKRRSDAYRFYERLGFAASHEGMKLRLS